MHDGRHHKVLYVSGEESAQQIALRAKRLALDASVLHQIAEIGLEKIQAHTADGEAGGGGDRFDPDAVFRGAAVGAGIGGAGARMRGAA